VLWPPAQIRDRGCPRIIAAHPTCLLAFIVSYCHCRKLKNRTGRT